MVGGIILCGAAALLWAFLEQRQLKRALKAPVLSKDF
jgi:hypothetical protein